MNTNTEPSWRIAPGRFFHLTPPRVMAILNVTPDSFSDGGRLSDPGSVVGAAQRAVRDGADMLDIGGESTRPGAERIDADEQIRRVAPAIGAIRDAGIAVPISVDTTLRAVAEAALDAGADVINDVSGGLEDAGMLPLASERQCGIILMHRLAPPDQDSFSDQYRDRPTYERGVVEEVAAALRSLAERAIEAGIDHEAIMLDPGLGFGKSVEQNLELVRGGAELLALGYPLLGASSRKSFTGRVGMLDHETEPPPPAERLGASIAFCLAQHATGIGLFRVHDVAEHARALRAAYHIAGGPTGGMTAGPAGVSDPAPGNQPERE